MNVPENALSIFALGSHFRFKNLIIVGLTQFLFYYFLFIYKSQFYSDSVLMNPFSTLVLFILCTVLITLGGYLINDFYDYEVDQVNKNRSLQLTQANLLKAYLCVLWIGFGLAFYISNLLKISHYILIFVVASFLLFLYAYRLKAMGLIGNVTVALFSAGVLGILWVAEKETINNAGSNTIESNSLGIETKSIFIFFMIFMFLISWIRELIKDCEDIEGDTKFGLKTFPITNGIQQSKIVILGLMVLTLFIAISWLYLSIQCEYLISSVIFTVIIIIYLIYILICMARATVKSNFTHLSKHCKLLMINGLIYFVTLQLFP